MTNLHEANPHWEYWYEIVDGESLRQGEIFRGLTYYALPQELPLPDDSPAEVKVETDRGDWIVMSASCDVVRKDGSYPHVLLGRVLPATKNTLKVNNKKELEKRLEILRRGLFPTFFLLAEHDGCDPAFPISYVQFRVHLTLPINYLSRASKGQMRLRLRSPIREKFGNWVGENFSRVGVEDEMALPRGKRGMSPAALLRMATQED